MDTLERTMLCRAEIAVSSGHPVNKGSIREFFIRDFLQGHIAEDLGITSGEIFDAEQKVGSRTNQIDIILYYTRYPRLQLSPDNIDAVMVDAAHATLEVKSELTKQNLLRAVKVIAKLRKLKLVRRGGAHFFSYIVAYHSKGGPQDVFDWLKEADELPEHFAICLLGKGFIATNWLVVQMHNANPERQRRINAGQWMIAKNRNGNLYFLFFLISLMRVGNDMWEYFPDRLSNVKYLDPPRD